MNNHYHKFEIKNELTCLKCLTCFCCTCCHALDQHLIEKYTRNNKFDAFKNNDDFIEAVAFINYKYKDCKLSDDEYIIKQIIE